MMYQPVYDYVIYEGVIHEHTYAGGRKHEWPEGLPVWFTEVYDTSTGKLVPTSGGFQQWWHCRKTNKHKDVVAKAIRDCHKLETERFNTWKASHQSSPATTTASTVTGIS